MTTGVQNQAKRNKTQTKHPHTVPLLLHEQCGNRRAAEIMISNETTDTDRAGEQERTSPGHSLWNASMCHQCGPAVQMAPINRKTELPYGEGDYQQFRALVLVKDLGTAPSSPAIIQNHL